ncbi:MULTISPECIES: HAD family hydrolase [Subtercola]|uniref:HAD-IB family hydrolase n=1 Tax=Subtercola vilae TaxID=2056433 RepID=A0A4T2C4J2_9MICO|nr:MULTISPECIES: HAD-IB family hydrolase [Subtercola]MEA9984745.1 HAD-IB family hydrolase [Subtercola sp. RTI3]TIH39017.1 HAD-IB family hydrolase [Subtercola vilae]
MSEPAPTPVIAFFDIDNTLVRGATIYLVGLGAWRLKLLRLRDVATFAWQQARFIAVGENMRHMNSAKDRTLELLRGHTEDELRTLGEEVYDRQIVSRLWPHVLERANAHLAQGDQVWLVSATAEIMAQVIASRLGFSGALGTRFESENGVFTGRLDGPMLHGAEKAAAVSRLAAGDTRSGTSTGRAESTDAPRPAAVDLADCWAYSDSSNDVPLLSAVGHPVAVNPDAGLEKLAAERGWPVLWASKKRQA